jgi:hypothetical protein
MLLGWVIEIAMGLNLSAFAVSELRVRGLMLVLVAVVLTAANTVLHGTGALLEVVAGAIIFGGAMYGSVRSRMGGVLAQAGTVRAAVSEPEPETEWRAIAQMLPALLIILLADFALSAVASVAGIPLGVGIALAVIATRLRAWENSNSLRLLHQVTPGNGTWTRWLSGLNPAEYSLCAEAGVTPAMTGTKPLHH